MNTKTWGQTQTGNTYHSFHPNGTAICRKSIKAGVAGPDRTESEVDHMGHKKCASCAKKEDAFSARLEASMQPSTGEGDYLPPADAATADVDPESVREDLVYRVWMSYPNAHAFQAEYDPSTGRLMGFTFRAELKRSSHFGWVALSGTFSNGLEWYRSGAADVLRFAPRK